MKSEPLLLVLFGHDENLLETRQWVLQSRGYRVLTVESLPAFKALPRTPPATLLILCHSLKPGERETAIAISRVRWPGCRQLSLAPTSGRAPTGLLGQLLHTMDGPAKLIATVSEMLEGAPAGPNDTVPVPHAHAS